MSSKTSPSAIALFLTLNILFFTLTSACGTHKCRGPSPPPKPKPSPCPSPPGGSSTPPGGSSPSAGSSSSNATCPTDALKLGVCANVLSGLLNVTLGQVPATPCCSVIQGLADLEAAVCLCTALKASILGISLNIPISLSLLLNVCSKEVPSGYQCS